MRVLLGFSVLGAAGVLVGCVPDFEDNLSTITEPRLLAIQSSPAEVEPGQEVTLRALVASPDDGAVEPAWSWCVTRKPLTELGPVSPECLTVVEPNVLPFGSGVEVLATTPKEGCTLFGPTRPEPKPGEPAGRPVDPDTTGGYYQPATALLGDAISIGDVRLSCGLPNASRDTIQAYNSEYRPNENPALESLTLQGDSPVELIPTGADDPPSGNVTVGAKVELRAAWAECPSDPVCGDGICSAFEDQVTCAEDCDSPRGCGGAEPYVSYDSNAGVLDARREGIRVAWYASAGQFEEELTGRDEQEPERDSLNAWQAPAEPGLVTLWLVIRDSRGGASWQSYRVEVE